MKRKREFKGWRMGLPSAMLILAGTYAVALAILHFGHMNPLVVALLPCLSFTLSAVIRR